MSKKNPLTNRERRICQWLAVVLLLGAVLSLAVVANSYYQYERFTQLQTRLRNIGRNVPPAAPLQTNLLLNGAAALALFGCITFLGLRLRTHLRARNWEQQLALARAVQSSLIPAGGAGGDSLRVAAEFAPAMEVGGDLYEVFDAGDGRVAFAIGDVSGKGIPAALMMSMLQGALRADPWYRSATAQEDFATRLNHLLYTRSGEARFATMFWGAYDPSRETIDYISAGHCPAFVMRGGAIERLEAIQRLDSSGPVLGLLPNSRYFQQQAAFYPGDVLVLYTDGLIEACNELGEEFGEARLCLALARCAGASAEEIRAEILREYRAFLGEEQADDDLTLLVLQAPAVAAPRERHEEEAELAVA